MDNVSNFDSSNTALDSEIEDQLSSYVNSANMKLPEKDDKLSQLYTKKISKDYNVQNAKKDSDHAINLLYIAYNTTPQEEGNIRIQISNLMQKVIIAQQESEAVMGRAYITADRIMNNIKDFFPDWQDVKNENSADEVKKFITKDLRELAQIVQKYALKIQKELEVVAKQYDDILNDTETTTNKSEKALSKNIENKKKVEEEIAAADAKRKRIEYLVEEIAAQVEKYDKLAREYQERAETAEERAFIMSIVKVCADVVSAVIPAAAMAAGGPISFIAASSMSTLNQATTSNEGGTTTPSQGSQQNEAELRSQASEAEEEVKASEKKKKVLQDKLDKLNEELKQKEEALGSASDDEDGKSEKAALKIEIEKKKDEIKETQSELDEEKKNHNKLAAALAGVQNSLNVLSQNMEKMSQEQKDQAASLREMQMQMLNKAEEYEKEKRSQTSELIELKSLLESQKEDRNTIELAIKSLNLSISALKKMQEIITELANFFKSFAAFMSVIVSEAETSLESIDRLSESDRAIGSSKLKDLTLSTDEFFIKQTAEWFAVQNVSENFQSCFKDGWSTLNKLKGSYIKGDELEEYLSQATVTLDEIFAEREKASSAKIEYINQAKKQA